MDKEKLEELRNRAKNFGKRAVKRSLPFVTGAVMAVSAHAQQNTQNTSQKDKQKPDIELKSAEEESKNNNVTPEEDFYRVADCSIKAYYDFDGRWMSRCVTVDENGKIVAIYDNGQFSPLTPENIKSAKRFIRRCEQWERATERFKRKQLLHYVKTDDFLYEGALGLVDKPDYETTHDEDKLLDGELFVRDVIKEKKSGNVFGKIQYSEGKGISYACEINSENGETTTHHVDTKNGKINRYTVNGRGIILTKKNREQAQSIVDTINMKFDEAQKQTKEKEPLPIVFNKDYSNTSGL